jgi:hypothetical protein
MSRTIRAAFAAATTTALMFTGAAVAAEPAAGWTANPGTTVTDDGVVVLDASGTTAGTSYENANLDVAVANGDTITFDYKGLCTAGAPRVFIQGGAYNTWDADPAVGSCGTDADGDGWFTVTGSVTGIVDGTAGHTGIVNDNVNNPDPISVRNLVIAGTTVQLVEEAAPGPKANNHGKCVSSAAKGGEERSAVAKSDCGKKAKKTKKAKSDNRRAARG